MVKKLFLCLFVYFTFVFTICAYNAYNQGDKVNYNGVEYYVMYGSDENSNILTLLKAEPFTVAEVEKYGVGHINTHFSSLQNKPYNLNGHGLVTYYTSEVCHDINDIRGNFECKYDYESSDVKYIIDAWAQDKLIEKDLWKDSLGYSYRLITKEEVIDYYNYHLIDENYYTYKQNESNNSKSFNNLNYGFWSLSYVDRINPVGSNIEGVYVVTSNTSLYQLEPTNSLNAIRPVVLLRKKALESKNSSNNNNSSSNNNNYNDNYKKSNNINNSQVSNNNNKKQKNLIVSVPDTLTKVSVLSITIGLILIGTATTIIIHIKNRSKNEKDN